MLMQFSYDATTDSFYMKLRRKTKAGPLQTRTLGDGIYADFDLNDQLTGLEVLFATRHFPKAALLAMAKRTQARKVRRAR